MLYILLTCYYIPLYMTYSKVDNITFNICY